MATLRKTSLKLVLHRHRVGTQVFARMSELVYVDGKPNVVLAWVSLGGTPTPLYTAELNPSKLRKMCGSRHTLQYEDTTIDPRYVDFEPLGADKRRTK